ncbi:MAG: DNA topoisomerase IB [Gemmatimonadota bacterium]|nr:DNA topoisomerase IB [Gemmatimonadota bacterium]
MAERWILRKGSKESGFQYVGANGARIRDKEKLSRIDALRIPPAWRDVHIATNARASIQVWGLDARGRKQYRYHQRAVQKGELRKYYRVRQMAKALPPLRKKILKDFKLRGFPRDKVCAGIVLLIADTFLRVGSDRYERENNTFGITTMRKSHVDYDGEKVWFEYVGKLSKDQKQFIVKPDLMQFIEELLGTPGARLFRYQRDGEWVNVDAREVNRYLQNAAGFPYTAKDLRTWGGTLRAAMFLAEQGSVKNEKARKATVAMMMRSVAPDLGNTPAIFRKSYVHPMVVTRYLKNGATIVIPEKKRRRLPHENSAEEDALIVFLDEYFPERRVDRRKRAARKERRA